MQGERRDARRDDVAAEVLAAPTPSPSDPDRFVTDPDPGGAVADPSPLPPPSADDVTDQLVRFLIVHLAGNRTRIQATLARFRAPDAVEAVPDAGVRAGLLALTGTLGDPVVEAFLAGELEVQHLAYGTTADPGRLVGPPAAPPPDAAADRSGTRVVDARLAGEPFPLLAGPLLHELLHHEPPVSDDEETVLHALEAAVHLQIISRSPSLAGTSGLARRQNSLALALLRSRDPGAAVVRLVGPGEPSPGEPGTEADFWSIPFTAAPAEPCPPTPAFARVLDALLAGAPERRRPTLVDRDLARLLDEQVFSRELHPADLLAAGVALGVYPTEVAVPA